MQDDLTFKGVVFNEMKGVYSSADSANMRAVQRALFPDMTYAVDSGGDPAVIPELTYDEFKDFHGRYYHPSNARFWFYGDDDPEERLRILDTYLSEFEAREVDSTVHAQPLFSVSSSCNFLCRTTSNCGTSIQPWDFRLDQCRHKTSNCWKSCLRQKQVRVTRDTWNFKPHHKHPLCSCFFSAAYAGTKIIRLATRYIQTLYAELVTIRHGPWAHFLSCFCHTQRTQELGHKISHIPVSHWQWSFIRRCSCILLRFPCYEVLSRLHRSGSVRILPYIENLHFGQIWVDVLLQEPRRVKDKYVAGEGSEGNEPKAFISLNWVLTDQPLDVETDLALQFLDYLLLGTSASPLKKALNDSNLGEAIIGGGLGDELRQPMFSLGLKGVDPARTKEVFVLKK